jgi:hypothetical protein
MDTGITITGTVVLSDIQSISYYLDMNAVKPHANGFHILFIERDSYDQLLRDPALLMASVFIRQLDGPALHLYGAEVYPYDWEYN